MTSALDLLWRFGLALTAAYVAVTALLFLGTLRRERRGGDWTPKVSVIVAVRNEEQSIRACLESLARLRYPPSHLKVLIADDGSSDGTRQIASEFTSRYPHFSCIRIDQEPVGLSGKAHAIAQGIEEATGEIICLTDADCRVPSHWVREMVAHFTDEVGLVGGATLLDEPGERLPMFEKVQSLDWGYLLSVGAGLTGVGLPVSLLGNNLAFRRAAYDAVGGFRGVPFSVTEDSALVRTIVSRTPWKARFVLSPNSLIVSRAKPNWREFYDQRKRWAIGARHLGLVGKAVSGLAVATHLTLPLALLWGFGHALAALVAIAIADFTLLFRTTGAVGRRDLLRYFLLFEAFYFGWTIAFGILALFSRAVHWKGRVYRVGRYRGG